MTEQHTGAASDKPNWPEHRPTPEENVRRLQARIVKAQEESKWNKVKVLQYLLTRSQSARILAVERVTETMG